MANVSEIEGIGPAFAAKLEANGIKTVAALLEAGASKKGRDSIADATGIAYDKILKWVNMADLFRIKGVGEEYSELLEAAGVDTVKELRNRNAENLHVKMVEVNEAKKLVRALPSASQVASWVDHAKTLDPMVTH